MSGKGDDFGSCLPGGYVPKDGDFKSAGFPEEQDLPLLNTHRLLVGVRMSVGQRAQPEISLVIPVSKASEPSDLTRLLSSVSLQTYKAAEILVVPDSGDTFACLKSAEPTWRTKGLPLTVLSTPKRIGASGARNLAAKFSMGEILGFLDDDVVLDSTWCQEVARTFNDLSVGAVSGLVDIDSDTSNLDYFPTALRWVIGGTYWAPDAARNVTGAAGMNFCVRKAVFELSGGYNDRLGPRGDRPETQTWARLGAEESDLALKIIQICQKKVLFNPRVRVVHRLRRKSLTPLGLIRRAMHVGYNRSYIRAIHHGIGNVGDYMTMFEVVKAFLYSVFSFPRHPFLEWRRMSLVFIIVFGISLGFSFGIVQFRAVRVGDSASKAA